MENLEQYRMRTKGFMLDSLPHEGGFETNSNLLKKVDGSGSFVPFAGDTVIFYLDEAAKTAVGRMQDILYRRCEDMMAEPLNVSSFHVTLHDLSNGNPSSELYQQMEQNKSKAEEILASIASETLCPVRVRTVSVMNMVNTSAVLGLEPADDDSCSLLMGWYGHFQRIVPLNYPLTLHVTLGYYRPGEYSEEQRRRLSQVFCDIKEECGEIFELDMKNLVYQRFKDMNNYY